MSNIPTIYVEKGLRLPDNDQWQFRFEVKSSSSDVMHTIAQNKKKKHWACSCNGYKRYRHCKHLESIGVPCYERPYEAKINDY